MAITESHLPDPILITGAARSGTSMVAGAIHLCGAFGGNMSGPNRNNAKGMFENAAIRNNITKPYLRQLGVDALGQFPLPNIHDLPIPMDWRSRVEKVIIEEGYENGPWIYKWAKMCLFWPVWYYAFPTAKWIIVRRKTSDIINSCLRTGFMRAFQSKEIQRLVGVENEHDGWLWWVHEHEKRFVQMIETGLNCKVVWPERMVVGDYRQLFETIEWLGLEWNSEVLNFIDPKLWKARHLMNQGPTPIPPKGVGKAKRQARSAIQLKGKTGIPKDWWRTNHRTEPMPSEINKDICVVCGKFGWWSTEGRGYFCLEHRTD